MTNSTNRDPANEGGWFSDPKYGRGAFLYVNIILCLGVIFFAIFVINTLMSDISGDYVLTYHGAQLARINLLKTPSALHGQLDTGRGALLELVTTELPRDDHVNLIFKTPDEKLRTGQKGRQIIFSGTIKDGIMSGTIQEGARSFKVRFERHGLDTVWKQTQILFPQK